MSYYYNNRQTLECPICGNEITVNQNSKKQKCKWCNHKLVVERKGAGRKTYLELTEFEYQK